MMQPPPSLPSKSTGMMDSISVSGSEPEAKMVKEKRGKNESMDILEAGDCVNEIFGLFFCCLGPHKTCLLFLPLLSVWRRVFGVNGHEPWCKGKQKAGVDN